PARVHALSLHDALPISGCAKRSTSRRRPHPPTSRPTAKAPVNRHRVLTGRSPRAQAVDEIGEAHLAGAAQAFGGGDRLGLGNAVDRKSTRLNSSHVASP